MFLIWSGWKKFEQFNLVCKKFNALNYLSNACVQSEIVIYKISFVQVTRKAGVLNLFSMPQKCQVLIHKRIDSNDKLFLFDVHKNRFVCLKNCVKIFKLRNLLWRNTMVIQFQSDSKNNLLVPLFGRNFFFQATPTTATTSTTAITSITDRRWKMNLWNT